VPEASLALVHGEIADELVEGGSVLPKQAQVVG
jgi:hypothetical protein